MALINEEYLGDMSIKWLKEIGYSFVHGSDLAPDGKSPEREDLREVILIDRHRTALKTQSRCSISHDQVSSSSTKEHYGNSIIRRTILF